MARLLFLPLAENALEFGSSVGLPVEDKCIVMKAAPISVSKPETTLTWSRKEDSLVFGSDIEYRVDEDGVLIPPSLVLQDVIETKK